MAAQSGTGPLESARSFQIHKCAGAVCCVFSSQALLAQPGGEACPDSIRQQHIIHQGGTKSAQLLKLTRDLLRWASPRLSTLRAVYLPEQVNRVADSLTRQAPAPRRWSLHSDIVRMFWYLYGQAEVDLFATEELTH